MKINGHFNPAFHAATFRGPHRNNPPRFIGIDAGAGANTGDSSTVGALWNFAFYVNVDGGSIGD